MPSGKLLMLVCSVAFAQAPGPEQLFRDAVAAQQRGDDALAIRKYRELLELRPDVPEVRANLGATLAHAGRYDEAIEQYRAALAKRPGNNELRFNLALAWYKKDDLPDAAAELSSLLQAEPGEARVATLLGDCYSRMGRYKDAIAALGPVEAAHPDDLTVAWLLGSAMIHDEQAREGLPRVERAAAAGHNAEAYMLAAQTWLGLNEFERANAAADAGIKLNPRLPGLYTLSGKIKQYLGDSAGAKADLEKALAADGGDFDAHLTMGAILNAERDLDGARKHIERALQIQPSSTLARYELGRIERSQGHIEAAVREFETVVKADPKWLRPHIELAALYYRLNRPEDGRKERDIVEKLSAQP